MIVMAERPLIGLIDSESGHGRYLRFVLFTHALLG
jgi:hypothetical protein